MRSQAPKSWQKQLGRETVGERRKGKNTNKWGNSGDREFREWGEKRRQKGTWPEVQPSSRHKSKMAWKHGTFGLSLFCFPTEGPNCSLAERRPLLRLDVLMELISCCLSCISQKSQINQGVNINQAAESCRAGNSFREKEKRRNSLPHGTKHRATSKPGLRSENSPEPYALFKFTWNMRDWPIFSGCVRAAGYLNHIWWMWWHTFQISLQKYVDFIIHLKCFVINEALWCYM